MSRPTTGPIINARQLVVVAVLVALAGLLAVFSLNAQRAVGAEDVAKDSARSAATPIGDALAERVEVQLAGPGLTYLDTTCPNYVPNLSVSPVQTCSSTENGKHVTIDVTFNDSYENFTAKVLRSTNS